MSVSGARHRRTDAIVRPDLASRSSAVGYGAVLMTMALALLVALAAVLGNLTVLVAAVILGVVAAAAAIAVTPNSVNPGSIVRRLLEMRRDLVAQLMPVICLSMAYPFVGQVL